jgi:NTP pyrophosphatase (non-canonical NTP hydrolase)
VEFKEYQTKAIVTAKYPDNLKVLYPALGLAGETGEVCEKIKKVFRDGNGEFTADKVVEIQKELGDVLWYISALCKDLGIELEDVAQGNLAKLYSRLERKMIHGDGDNR